MNRSFSRQIPLTRAGSCASSAAARNMGDRVSFSEIRRRCQVEHSEKQNPSLRSPKGQPRSSPVWYCTFVRLIGMTSSTPFIRRALLYGNEGLNTDRLRKRLVDIYLVPASSMRFLEKARLLTVDSLVYDLEDSISSGAKPDARRNVESILSQSRPTEAKEQAVRINAVDSGHTRRDLEAIVRPHEEQLAWL